jgi:HD-GYP domain-containing protein (c-di-GMP phosphodiesterase class II)
MASDPAGRSRCAWPTAACSARSSPTDARPAARGQDKLALASAYASIVALGLDRLDRESSLAARYHAVVVALTTALDARDDYTGRHSSETSVLAVDVGRRLRMDETQLELLSQVAVLHDVGKLGISTEVLVKQAR